jgi:outer membrane protein OmpA-like peptidoglycan-associated protein
LPNNSNEFDEKTLPKDNLKIYYRILDIIGSRMRKYPDSKLYLKGTQDSKESEVNPDYNIALDRAESVKMYISMKWGIDTNRLICGFLKKATLPTSELYQEGFVENRRVEVSSDNLKILEPVIHTKFAEYIYENENIEIKPKLNDNIKSSQIEFILNNNKIKSYTSDSLSNNFNVNDIFENTVLKETDNLRIKYKVINSQNLTEELQQSIPIKISDNQYEIGRLNLIVFDFDRFDLTEINKSMIENFIKYAVFDKSKVNITGSTDKLGEMNYNMNLSQNRAENVATFLKSIVPNIKINNIKGIGPSLLKYDNSTPEGRFYSRTVMIEVETPIK